MTPSRSPKQRCVAIQANSNNKKRASERANRCPNKPSNKHASEQASEQTDAQTNQRTSEHTNGTPYTHTYSHTHTHTHTQTHTHTHTLSLSLPPSPKAYSCWLSGLYAFERKNWKEAQTSFLRCKELYLQLVKLAADEEEQKVYERVSLAQCVCVCL